MEVKSMTPQVMDSMRDIIAGRKTMQEAADFLQEECSKKIPEGLP